MAQTDTLWDKAKQLSRERNKHSDWAFTMELYRRLGGNEHVITGTVSKGSVRNFRIIGMINNDEALVLSQGKLEALDNELVFRSKKTFSIADSSWVDNTYDLTEVKENATSVNRTYDKLNEIIIQEKTRRAGDNE